MPVPYETGAPAACVSCRLSGAPCQVPFVSGSVSALEEEAGGGRTVRLQTEDGEERRIVLPAGAATAWQLSILAKACAVRDPAGNAVRAGFFHLEEAAGGLRFTPHSLFVLEPDWLFNVRTPPISNSATGSGSCPFTRATRPACP